MNLFKLLYYYYFSFYKKFDNEPHSMTVFVLAVCESFPIVFIMQIASARAFCRIVPTWYSLLIGAAFIGLNYVAFIRSGLSKKIVKSPPPIIVSTQFSKGIAIAFFVITVSTMVCGPILAKSIMDNCR